MSILFDLASADLLQLFTETGVLHGILKFFWWLCINICLKSRYYWKEEQNVCPRLVNWNLKLLLWLFTFHVSMSKILYSRLCQL